MTFVTFLDIVGGTEGKDKLEWSRTVDAEKLEQLKEMMASPDYKVFGKQLGECNLLVFLFSKTFPN